MTAVRTSELDGVIVRSRVGVTDLLWLTWRQHRWMIVSGLVVAGVLGGYILWNEQAITRQSFFQCGGFCFSSQFFGIFADRLDLANFQIDLVAVVGWIIAVFWAAPLVAREYEQRTNLLAWSQDVTPLRWLAGKVVALAVVAAATAIAVGAVAASMGERLATIVNGFSGFHVFEGFNFELFLPLQVAYALFGFALGLAASALIRRTVPAMGVTALAYIGVRAAFYFARPYYLSPVRATAGPVVTPAVGLEQGDLYLDGGYLDSAGRVMSPDQIKFYGDPTTIVGFRDSLRRDGVAGSFTDYQPADRLITFRLIETGIFVVLAAVLFVVTWLRMRRPTTTG